MSSRNVRLSADERARAVALPSAACAPRPRRRRRPRSPPAHAVRAPHGIEPEYLAMVDPDTFQPQTRQRPRHRAVAATVGDIRLIDNVLIERAATPERRGADPKGAVSVLPTPA